MSEYYKNSSSNYTSNTSLPNIGSSLSVSMFKGLSNTNYTDINILYTTVGTYTYTVPVGIVSLCVLCIGGGGSGIYNLTTAASGGGGGGLIWVNNIIVSPGQLFTIVIGAGGNGAGSTVNPTGQNGSPSRFYFNTGTTFNIQANGGGGGSTRTGGTYALTNTAGFTIGTFGGGNGGNGGAGVGSTFSGGGGGAGGYTGDGGTGGTNAGAGTNSTAGGGGGGGSAQRNAAGGGGVGILNGMGANGAGGAYNGLGAFPGTGGSGGTSGGASVAGGSLAGGLYGGGGGGNRYSTYPNLNRSGNRCAVRIMALISNSTRSFPSNAAAF